MVDTLGIGRKRLIEKIIVDNWNLIPETKTFNYSELLYVIQELLSEEGKPYLQGGPRVPRFGTFKFFAKHLLYRNLANYDSMILITAEKGVGKSSAAIMLAREWMTLLGRKFDPKRHIAYNNADVMTKIDNLEKFECIICDEAVRFASAADWAKKENKLLKIKLAQVRTKHLLYILCFPLKVYKLEKNYLESFTNYWCLTGDTKITTKDKFGMIRQTPIKNVNNFFAKELLTYNINENKYEFKLYEKKVKTLKNAEIYEMELINGLKIKCTKEHLFLTQRGYIKLCDLKEDDKIEVKTKICKGCGKEFIPKKQQMIWCTKKCKSLTSEYKQYVHSYQVDYHNKNYNKLKEKNKERYLKNREKILEKAKKYRDKHRERYRLYMLNRRKNNPDYVRRLEREWRLKNRNYILPNIRKKYKERYNNDVVFKLKIRLGTQLKQKLKAQYIRKTNDALYYLGCSIETFKTYLENKFKENMCWLNYGPKGWHIDHIKPSSKFNLTKEEEIKKCFHYTNMQPLWWYENLSKSDKYVGDD